VLVPEPGEYVALGAARQAAALVGADPLGWPTRITTIPADPRPEILAAYRSAVGAV
jgi:xylulokinase